MYANYTEALKTAINTLDVPSFVIHSREEQKNDKDLKRFIKLEKDCVDITKYVDSVLKSVIKSKNNSFNFTNIIDILSKLEDNKSYFDNNLKTIDNELKNFKFVSLIFENLNKNGYLHIDNFDDKTKFYTYNENKFLEKNGLIAKILDTNISDKEKLLKLADFVHNTLEKEVKSFSFYIEDTLFKEKFTNPDITLKDIENLTKPLIEKYIGLSGKSLGLATEMNHLTLSTEISKIYEKQVSKTNELKEIKKSTVNHIDFS